MDNAENRIKQTKLIQSLGERLFDEPILGISGIDTLASLMTFSCHDANKRIYTLFHDSNNLDLLSSSTFELSKKIDKYFYESRNKEYFNKAKGIQSTALFLLRLADLIQKIEETDFNVKETENV